jgi:hypothetical protein
LAIKGEVKMQLLEMQTPSYRTIRTSLKGKEEEVASLQLLSELQRGLLSCTKSLH